MKKVLIIGSRQAGTKNDPNAIASGLCSDDVTTKLVYWEDIIITVKGGSVQILVDGSDIIADTPDLVIAVGWYKNGRKAIYRDLALSVSLVLKHAGIPFWNREIALQRSSTKLSTMVQLALEGIPVPDSYFSLDVQKVASMLERPFIAKAVSASRGNLNFLVENDEIMTQVTDADADFLIQPFLPNDHDLRVICFDGKPRLILRRARQEGVSTHLNNTSQGGDARWLELSEVAPELLTLSEKICTIMGREMAGIDLIPDATSVLGYSCLEVNAVPQLTSGTDSDKKLAAFAQAIREL